jgi:hypothetical protein
LTFSKKRSPTITGNEFSNIKLICNHFKPALDEWQTSHNIKFPTPEQVMCKFTQKKKNPERN